MARPMTLLRLLLAASRGYTEDTDDGFLRQYFNNRTGQVKSRATLTKLGDGLARFIVVEIAETYDPEATDDQQIAEAIRVMDTARREIEGVIRALERM